MSSETPRMTELLQAYKSLEKELCSNTHPWENQLALIQQMNALSNEIMCETYPHLKNQTCPLCNKKFNGWGNNPAPLEVEGKVCDTCNQSIIIPIRMGNKKLEKIIMKKLTKNKK